jgi:Fe-S cluster assembly protein SufB
MAAQGLSRLAEMEEVSWAKLDIPPIDFQDAYYYAEPKKKPKLGSLDEVDPEILRVYEKLGIPIEEQKVLAGVEGARKVAVDAVFDSVSVATTFRAELERAGVIFRSISEAVREYPDLVRKYLGSVVPQRDNYFACLNARSSPTAPSSTSPRACAARWSCRTYFRINAENTGQFERTLIVADKGSYVSYLEGCTAPMRDENQLHAAVVELVAHDDAEIKYSHRPELVSGRRRRARAASTISSPSGRCAPAPAPRSAGPRSRPAPPSPGNIRAAS